MASEATSAAPDESGWVDVETLVRFYDATYFGGVLADAVSVSWHAVSPSALSARAQDGFTYCRAVSLPLWTGPSWELSVGVACSRRGSAPFVRIRLPVALRVARLGDAVKVSLLHALVHAYLFVTSSSGQRAAGSQAHGEAFQQELARLDERARVDPFRPAVGYSADTSGWSANALAADDQLRALHAARDALRPEHFALLRLVAACSRDGWLPELGLQVLVFEAVHCGALPALFKHSPAPVSLPGGEQRLVLLQSQEARNAVADLLEARLLQLLRYSPRGAGGALATAYAPSPDGLAALRTHTALLSPHMVTAVDALAAGPRAHEPTGGDQTHVRVHYAGGAFSLRWPGGTAMQSPVTHVQPLERLVTRPNLPARLMAVEAQRHPSEAERETQPGHGRLRASDSRVVFAEWLPLGAASLESLCIHAGAAPCACGAAMRLTPSVSCRQPRCSEGALTVELLSGALHLGAHFSASGDSLFCAETTMDTEEQDTLTHVLAAMHAATQQASNALLPEHCARLVCALHGPDSCAPRPTFTLLLARTLHPELSSPGDYLDGGPAEAELCRLLGEVSEALDLAPLGVFCVLGARGVLAAGPGVTAIEPTLRAYAAARARQAALDTLNRAACRCRARVCSATALLTDSQVQPGALSAALEAQRRVATDLEEVLRLISAPHALALAAEDEDEEARRASARLLHSTQMVALERSLAARYSDCAATLRMVTLLAAAAQDTLEQARTRDRMRAAVTTLARLRAGAALLRHALAARAALASLTALLCGALAFSALDRLTGAWRAPNVPWLRRLLRPSGSGSGWAVVPWTPLTVAAAAAFAALLLLAVRLLPLRHASRLHARAQLGARPLVLWRLEAHLRRTGTGRGAATLRSRSAATAAHGSAGGRVRDVMRWHAGGAHGLRGLRPVATLAVDVRSGRALRASLDVHAPSLGSRAPPSMRPAALLASLAAELEAACVWARAADTRRLSSAGTVPWGWPPPGASPDSLRGTLTLRVRRPADASWRQLSVGALTLNALRTAVAAKLSVLPSQVTSLALLQQAQGATSEALEDDASVVALRPGDRLLASVSGAPSPALAQRRVREATLARAAEKGARLQPHQLRALSRAAERNV